MPEIENDAKVAGPTLRDIAVETLRGVCLDKEAPAAAKAQSARTILELMGELGRGGDARGEVETRDTAGQGQEKQGLMTQPAPVIPGRFVDTSDGSA